MSGKIKKIKLKFNDIDISYDDGTNSNEIKIKQVEFGNLNVFNSGDRRDKIIVTKLTDELSHYKYDLNNDNNGQTEYTLNIPSDTTADILLVAGGGGGGCRQVDSSFGSGGGGAGELVFLLNKELKEGSYTIKVGNGGRGGSYSSKTDNQKGFDTEIIYNEEIFLFANGGGEGGNRNWNTKYPNVGKSGGSSGGCSPYSDHDITINSEPRQITNYGTYSSFGNNGASSTYRYDITVTPRRYVIYTGGGGGAGDIGESNGNPNGGIGKFGEDTIDFKTHFAITDTTIGEHHTDGKVYFAGGGGGSYSYYKTDNGGIGGLGGGGNGEFFEDPATNGASHTGGGGGAGTYFQAGDGGSGIVIINLKKIIEDSNLSRLIDNDDSTYNNFNLNDTIIFTLNDDSINRKNILNSLNQIILKTEKINQFNNLNYDVILQNDEGDEILFETINISTDMITHYDNYSKCISGYFSLFSEERLYPPYIFREELPLLTSNIFTISNKLYGNGNYEINYSSRHNSVDNTPLNIFKNDFTSFTWGNNNYNRDSILPLRDTNLFSTYNNIDFDINGFYGDLISIKMPKKIILTKFILVIKDYNNVTLDNLSKFPLYFKIFGKDILKQVWKEIVEITINKYQLNNIYNDQYFINTYRTSLDTFNYQGVDSHYSTTLELTEDIYCDILIVAGGGAGGESQNADRGGGGGGAGGLIYIDKIILRSGTYNIMVGNGGQYSNDDGFNSSITNDENKISFVANGGGGGGNTGISNTSGRNGGSGGGGADYNGYGGNTTNTGEINYYGNNGGIAIQSEGRIKGGSGAGGGGAGSSGQNSNGFTKGLGGTGKIINISGQNIEYAKGGDGGRYNDGDGNNGLVGTGNGGNGAGRNGNRIGGKGGSGIIIIKKYSNYYNSYKHVFDENNKRKTGLEEFEEYALVINKIGGNTNVDFGTWEIYGKEKFSELNQVPSNIPLKRNIKFSHFNKVFEGNININSNISIDDYLNYIPNNSNKNLSFSTFKGLSIDSGLPVIDNILARYIPNNIYMTFSQDNDIIGWNDIYNNYNITNIYGSPSIQKITPNSKGLYTDNRITISTMIGTENDIIQFPFTLPENYTFCYIARYTGKDPNNNKRIFNSINSKTYWCFNNNTTCTSMYNDNIYSTTIKQMSDNDYWIIGIETGDSMRYNGMDCTNYIYDSTYSINNNYEYQNDNSDTNSITINGGHENNRGSWEIGELIFYDRKLNLEEKIKIEEYFANRYYHISFTSVVNSIDVYQNIITNEYSIDNDDINDTNDDFYIWYNVYNGYKYAYSKLNSSIYGPANYLSDIKRFKKDDDVYYYWILFVDNQNNENKFLEITIPNTEHNLYLIALGGGGSAGSYDDYIGFFSNEIISGSGNAGELKILDSNINNNSLQIQVGHGGKMLEKEGSDGGDSKISIKNGNEILNSIGGNKGTDFSFFYNHFNTHNINGGTISEDLKTYLNDNSFSLDDILTNNYTYWSSDLTIDEQTESGKYYGYGAPGVRTNDKYSGSSGVVAIIQSLEIFRN